jgi:nickel/cobalt exporter
MASLTEVFNAGAANAWVFAPSAILLGALHGLEPGHSKTMMAAFIVAIRGTAAQAILLALAATVSHTAIVWAVALTGLYLGARWGGETQEAYLQIASGALIVAVAAWMTWRTWRGAGHRHDDREHDHPHDHDHDHAHPHPHDHVHAAERPGDAAFEHDLALIEPSTEADEHERAHALDINRRFANRNVTTGQIVLFGLTGGLIPCPASITVLLLCLQVGRFGLGAALVLCFSVGLALTLTLVGVGAALGMRHASARWPRIDALAARAPYLSGALVTVLGLLTLWSGVSALA